MQTDIVSETNISFSRVSFHSYHLLLLLLLLLAVASWRPVTQVWKADTGRGRDRLL